MLLFVVQHTGLHTCYMIHTDVQHTGLHNTYILQKITGINTLGKKGEKKGKKGKKGAEKTSFLVFF